MKVQYKGEELFVFDYIFKNNETVEVLIIAPHFGKQWINVPRSCLIEEDIKPDNKTNHYE